MTEALAGWVVPGIDPPACRNVLSQAIEVGQPARMSAAASLFTSVTPQARSTDGHAAQCRAIL